ncbi:MAG TPA: hypothetical protein VKE24_01260 [Candidatus Acidoferrales bacterium]|nr:hypothetical protein [Candidatus Acidoferrales bacterium]
MIAALIFAVSVAALLQFFVSYCRSVLAASAKAQLSEQGREVAGISGSVTGDDFRRLIRLVYLCPEPGGDRNAIRAVRAYFRLLRLVRAGIAKLVPATADWLERECEGCAYFAAVALDRRISFSRDLMARQMANGL